MYDIIIIGSWSAWLPAWMYASRYQLKNIIIGELPWGALSTSHCVENYPGILSDSWSNIMKQFEDHAKKAWSEILQDRVENVSKIGEDNFEVITQWGKKLHSKRIIIATGNTYKMLWVLGEKEFYGQGVSYCATCDGSFYKNLTVGVVWAWNTAITEALYLSEIAKTVHILVRWNEVRAENIWTEKAKNKDNIIFHYETEVKEITGNTMWVNGIITKNNETIPLDGIFIAIGSKPITEIIDNLNPNKDDEWCLIVNKKQETSISGIYAAGDVTTNSDKFRQTIMSAAEWCLAAHSIHEDLMKNS